MATLPARRDAVAELARRTDLVIGFRQLISVRRPAAGVTPWRDHAAVPHIGEHGSPGGSFRPGLMGMMAAGAISGGPPGPGGFGFGFGFGEGYGTFGASWAFRAALTASGQSPTVLAFALGRRPGRVVYEVLNQPEPMTFVFRTDGGLTAINRALDDAGFQATAVAPAGQVPHDARWPDRITELLAD